MFISSVYSLNITNLTETPAATGRKTSLGLGTLIGVLIVCALAIWTKWDKLPSLLSGDSPWWLHEVSRFAWGEMPYRDFYWPYGPLSIAVFSYPMRWFGVRFETAQIVIDALSLIIVFLYWRILRYLLPARLHFPALLLLVAVGATAQTYFSLFSIQSYTPSVHVAAIGMFLMLLGIFRQLDRGSDAWTVWIIVLGAWISWLGKQETLLASVILIFLLAVFDRPLSVKRYLVLSVFCFAPPVLIYAGVLREAGVRKSLACLQAFGLATTACPWWPTGLGVLGAFSALGEAIIAIAFASLFDLGRWRTALGRKYALLWIAAALGLSAYLTFEWVLWSRLLFGPGPFLKRAIDTAPELLSSSAVLRPVLWCTILYWLYLAVLGLRSGLRLSKDRLQLLLLITVPVVMGIRSLFGTILVNWPEVPAIVYPFLLMVAPYLLLRVLHVPYRQPFRLFAGNRQIPVWIAGSLMVMYAVLRIAGAYSGTLTNSQFTPLSTASGFVLDKDGAVDLQIYEYVMRNTTPSDTILEMPFGGGMTVATGRRSPIYSTLFFQLRPPPYVQEEDVRRIREHPPQVIITPEGEHLGSTFGVKGNVGCEFPHFVWQPNRLSWDPAYVLPVTRYIEQNYRMDRKIGKWLLWRPVR